MELKFRGMDANGVMRYGRLSQDKPNSTRYYKEYSQRICWDDSNIPVSNKTLGQATGLKDIFQDDIVSFGLIDDPETAHIGTVVYSLSRLGWMIKSPTIPTSIEESEIFYPSGEVSMALVFQEYIETIGNKWEHPELLEQPTEHKEKE